MDRVRRRRVAVAAILSLFVVVGLVGPVEGAVLTRVALLARPQLVEVEGIGTARFEASGEGRFAGDGGRFRGKASLRTETLRYSFRFREAAIIEDAAGNPIGLSLSGRGRAKRDGQREAFEFSATVQPDPTMAECLIYDILGPNVHLRFVAVSTLRIAR